MRRLFSKAIVTWLALGFPLSWHKSSIGAAVDWIGLDSHIKSNCVEVTVPEVKLAELQQLTTDIQRHTVITLKALRSYTGKVQSIASLLHVLRPFVGELWAALHSRSRAPRRHIWRKQVRHTLRWLKAFLHGQILGGITRKLYLDAYFNRGRRVQVVSDASPWGLGAVRLVDGVAVSWLSIPIGTNDSRTLQVQTGSSSGQPVWEALTVLIAMRGWLPVWREARTSVAIRTDNITTISMLIKVKGTSPALRRIAKELALDLAEGTYEPDAVEHTPGVQNTVADVLSRRYEPGRQWAVPEILHAVAEFVPPARPRSWWRSL